MSAPVAFHFLDLPFELWEPIFVQCRPLDIIRASQTNQFFHALVSNSIVLQYTILLHRSSAQDNPECKLPLPDRIEALERRQQSWFDLKPDFRAAVPVPFDTGHVYDLSEGVLVFGDLFQEKLGFLRLPEKKEDPLEWEEFKLLVPENSTLTIAPVMIVDFGLSVAQDLIAVVYLCVFMIFALCADVLTYVYVGRSPWKMENLSSSYRWRCGIYPPPSLIHKPRYPIFHCRKCLETVFTLIRPPYIARFWGIISS